MNVKSLLIIAACLLCLAAVGHSQEIQYDTSAAKLKLGKELWKIQGTNGLLTMSLDGSKILVTSNHNGHTFSIVDIERGTAKLLKGVEYYDNNDARSYYTIDPAFTMLYVNTQHSKPKRYYEDAFYDLLGDSILSKRVYPEGSDVSSFGRPIAISKKYGMMVTSDGRFHAIPSYDTVLSAPLIGSNGSYGTAWMDDAHGKVYFTNTHTVSEFDIQSRVLLSWDVSKSKSLPKIIRGPNSAWLYVATLNDGNSIGGNAVYAFNTENNEKIEFTQHPGGAYAQQLVHMPEGTIWVTPTGVGVQGYSGNTMNPRGQMAWELSAETRSTKIMLSPDRFTYRGNPSTKNFVITPDFSKAIHCWNTNGDSAIIRCNELVPNITSIPTPEQRTSSWFTQKPSSIEIRQALQAAIVRVEIATMEGRLVLQRPVTVQEQIITIPTQGLAAGAYMCTVNTEKEILSTLFICNE